MRVVPWRTHLVVAAQMDLAALLGYYTPTPYACTTCNSAVADAGGFFLVGAMQAALVNNSSVERFDQERMKPVGGAILKLLRPRCLESNSPILDKFTPFAYLRTQLLS